jgi:rubrerythrin
MRRKQLDGMSNPTGQFDGLQQIIDFAIQKEQEAIDFYTDVAAHVQTGSISEEIRKIAAMEVQHRERLKRMDIAAVTSSPVKKAADLKIADYLVAPEPTVGMTWQDILNIAMHRELTSMRLYTDLAELVEEPGAKRLFEHLAAEESNHKLFFESVWDDEVLLEN